MMINPMVRIIKFTLFFYLVANIFSFASGSENFFKKGLELFNNKKYDDARFMFEKSIVFNPKNSNSYLYLAKIYNIEENQKKEEINLETSLLIEPNNEEAILMSMEIALEKSNYSKVKDLSKIFTKVCKKLCNQNKDILKTLDNIEPKDNES
jgi:tetratricopeptide (TPR) repeat protein